LDVEEHPELMPITFSCEETLGIPPEKIADQILDISSWSGFQGYGVLPGIKTAEFKIRTPEIVGSRIQVTNTDGSSHVEEVVHWEPNKRVRLHMRDFSPPLSRLTTGFEETWEFSRIGQNTRVVRSFELTAKSSVTRPLLWLISILLKRAIASHLRQMRDASYGGTI
jgi:polyketide cyclase/dehydrase/lipid transport protein